MSVPLKSVFSSTSSDINCHIQAKAFVELEKVKIRKGNHTNAMKGLKYFLPFTVKRL